MLCQQGAFACMNCAELQVKELPSRGITWHQGVQVGLGRGRYVLDTSSLGGLGRRQALQDIGCLPAVLQQGLP